MPKKREEPRYDALITRIFLNHYRPGTKSFEFDRGEIEHVAKQVKVILPKNLGDLIYSFKFRKTLPQEIRSTAPVALQWSIEPAGRSKYRFVLGKPSRIVPREDLLAIKVPDATPEIIAVYALSDEQALLAKVRYNRLVDLFLGITTYSLQNHLRTTVPNIGQIEIDEIYVGVNRNGQQFVIPVQAKGGTDQLAVVQTKQDLACCAKKFPQLRCRPVSAQFMADNVIAMFELAVDGDDVRVLEEKHYKLVPAESITAADLELYAR